MLRLVALLLTVLLASCAPMQGSQESWARQIFGPSSETLKVGCGKGFDEDNTFTMGVGRLRLKTSSGRVVRFTSAPGQIFVMCRLFGVIASGRKGRDSFLGSEGFQRFSKSARPFIVIEGSELNVNQVKVAITLESETGQKLLEIKPDSNEAFTNGIRFDFKPIAPEQRTLLDSVSSFTIALTIGEKTEQFRVEPTTYAPLAKMEDPE
jgi:hypothetical protein